MYQVPADFHAQIAADRARCGLSRSGRAQRLARGGDGVRALEDRGDDRAAGDVVHQALEERLAFVLAVMALRECLVHQQQAHAHRLQTALLQAAQDLEAQPSLHRVRLHQDQRAFHVGHRDLLIAMLVVRDVVTRAASAA